MSVDADIEDSVDLFGLKASDLQSDVTIDDGAVFGTLKYVDDYSSAYGTGEDSGNYLVLHFEVPETTGATITVELVGGVHGPRTLDEDGIIILRITDKNLQTIKVVASKTSCETVTRTYSLRGLKLLSE